jgi:hypothetical protein
MMFQSGGKWNAALRASDERTRISERWAVSKDVGRDQAAIAAPPIHAAAMRSSACSQSALA